MCLTLCNTGEGYVDYNTTGKGIGGIHCEGISKSELVRNCIINYYTQVKNGKTPHELGEQYFGKLDSGNHDLATERKRIFREKVNAKKGGN